MRTRPGGDREKGTSKKKNVGPGKKVISIYGDEKELEVFRNRAKGLGMSLSEYFARLAREDLRKGGGITIHPGVS